METNVRVRDVIGILYAVAYHLQFSSTKKLLLPKKVFITHVFQQHLSSSLIHPSSRSVGRKQQRDSIDFNHYDLASKVWSGGRNCISPKLSHESFFFAKMVTKRKTFSFSAEYR